MTTIKIQKSQKNFMQEFNKNQKIVSDFDKEIRKIKGDNNGKK